MFWKFPKLHEPLGECNLRTFSSNYYSRIVRGRSSDFLFIVYSTKLPSTNQNGSSSVFTSENFETLQADVGNLRKTSVERRTTSKFFVSTSESFGSLRVNFGCIRKISADFGKLRVNFGKKTNWYSWEYNLGLIVLLSSNQNSVIFRT